MTDIFLGSGNSAGDVIASNRHGTNMPPLGRATWSIGESTAQQVKCRIAFVLWVVLQRLDCRGCRKTTLEFFLMAAIVALVLGGSQALSRSLYAQLIPTFEEAEYYSIYEISDKGTTWLCPLFFGLALQFKKSYRIAILSLIVFFLGGLLVLLKVGVERGERDVALH